MQKVNKINFLNIIDLYKICFIISKKIFIMSVSIYIHYPFCRSKCPYCDFNYYCNINIDEEELLQAYLNEINYYHKFIDNNIIDTIYFGGGTPSLMSEKLLDKVINKIFSLYIICLKSIYAAR